MTDAHKYHARRAVDELDLALRASSVGAAQAHFRLSSLHLEKSQAPGETAAPRLAESPSAQP